MKIIILLYLSLHIIVADTLDLAIKEYNSKNYELSLKYFHEVGENKLMAQYWLGTMYERGLGTQKNQEKAIYWYKKAADSGHAIAQYIIAKYYHDNITIKDNKNKVFYYYEKSAKNGFELAQFELALIYIEGDLVLQDFKKAKELLITINVKNDIVKKIWKKHQLWKY